MELQYHKCNTLAEAIALNAAYSDFPVLAGGTDLIVQWRSGVLELKGIVDISCVDEMKSIDNLKDSIEIGACVTHVQIINDEAIKRHAPLLSDACSSIGAVQIQNRGTIGGNIMNASPAGDTLPVLLAYDVELKLQDVKGERWVRFADFYADYRKTVKKQGELLTKIRLHKKRWRNEKGAFVKVGTRKAQAISKVSLCMRASITHGAVRKIAIAAGSVAAVPVRASGTEALITGKVITPALIRRAKASIADEFKPIDDIRSTSNYRRFLCGNLLERFLKEAIVKPNHQ